VNDLKRFIVLQARMSEFLAQLDEVTLDAIVSGTAQFAIRQVDTGTVSPESAPRATPVGHIPTPSRDPSQAAQDLSRLTSEQERRIYLNAADLPVKGLRQVAKAHGLPGYSKLTRPGLIDLLAGHSVKQTDAHADEVRRPEAAATSPVGSGAAASPLISGPKEPQRTTVTQPTETAKPAGEVAAIAARLRETETEEEGAAYLRAEHLDRVSLLAVAAELQLTRVDRLSQTELEKRVLKQAIGARRKFAGLRKW
jgi:hypothetical protein